MGMLSVSEEKSYPRINLAKSGSSYLFETIFEENR